MKNMLLLDGEIIQDITVSVAFPKKRAPFRHFALINCDAKLPIEALFGLDGKLLLALVFAAKPLTLKELSEIVDTPTSCAFRSLRRLNHMGLVEKPGRGIYRASRSLVHYGRWKRVDDAQEAEADA